MDVKKKGRVADLSAVDCEALFGIAMIARWLGLSVGAARGLIDSGLLPTFRAPGRSVRCALKAELNAAFREWSKRERR
jgi:hypothetical protein